ncbi:MAG: amidohydrolase family protein, partial [Chloroflexi bacterium]|nr:amidohydrolase family protein [Chloroflexota bacterium]
MTEKADFILFNATVLTMEPEVPRAQMVAVRSGRIIGLGRNEDRDGFQGSGTRLIDCEGKTVVPGFHDAHMHLFALVSNLISLDCSP